MRSAEPTTNARSVSDPCAVKAARLIAQYTPRHMPADLWQLCAAPVRAALTAVAGAAPRAVATYGTALTWLLTVTPHWDRATTPDLRALLSLTAIDDAVRDADLTPVTARNRRAWLRQISREVGASPNQKIAHHGLPPRPADPLLLGGATHPLPFATLAQAWETRSGRRLDGKLLPPVAAALRARQVTAPTERAVTFLSPVSTRRLAEVLDNALVITVTSLNDRPATQGPGQRPLSRRAMLALAKKLSDGTTPSDVKPPAPPEVVAAVAAYRPSPKYAPAWNTNQALAEQLVLGYRPPTPLNAKYVCSVLAGFLSFVHTWPARASTGPLELEDLTADAVAAWIVSASLKDSSRATFRTVVRRAIKAQHPHQQLTVAYTPALPPYSPEEMVTWRRLATTQPTRARAASLSFIIGLGAGAGLNNADLRTVRASSISKVPLAEGPPVLTVTTANPHRPRTVPIRRLYEPLVRRALDLHHAQGKSADDLILGTRADRNIVIRQGPRTARTATEELAVEPTRLRNTWLVALMCADVPLADLLHASGLTGARTLADLLPYCPPSDPDTITEVLATIGGDR